MKNFIKNFSLVLATIAIVVVAFVAFSTEASAQVNFNMYTSPTYDDCPTFAIGIVGGGPTNSRGIQNGTGTLSGCWVSKSMTVVPGDIINVAYSLQNNSFTQTAHDVRIKLDSTPNGFLRSHNFNPVVSARNGVNYPEKASANLNDIIVRSNQNFKLEPGEITLYPSTTAGPVTLTNSQSFSNIYSTGIALGAIGPQDNPFVEVEFKVVANPLATTDAVTNQTSTSVRLNGRLKEGWGSVDFDPHFEYRRGTSGPFTRLNATVTPNNPAGPNNSSEINLPNTKKLFPSNEVTFYGDLNVSSLSAGTYQVKACVVGLNYPSSSNNYDDCDDNSTRTFTVASTPVINPPSVRTLAANQAASQYVLTGRLTNLGDGNPAEVYFMSGQAGTNPSTWTRRNSVQGTLSVANNVFFTPNLTFSPGNYEFQACARGTVSNLTQCDNPVLFTVAGPTLTNPTVQTRAATILGATMNGRQVNMEGRVTNLGGSNAVTNYLQYRNNNTTNWTRVNGSPSTSTSAPTTFDATRTFTPGSYSFRACAESISNPSLNACGSIVGFTIAGTPPPATTLSVVTIGNQVPTTNSVVLEGNVPTRVAGTTIQAYFQYRRVGAPTWLRTNQQPAVGANIFAIPVSGLTAAANYEFRACGYDAALGFNQSVCGAILNFTTQTIIPSGALAITTNQATNIATTSAQLNGTVTSLGPVSAAQTYLRYRRAGLTGWTTVNTAVVNTAGGTFVTTATGLTPSTTYQVQACGYDVNLSSANSVCGIVRSFTTTTPTNNLLPVISNLFAGLNTANTAADIKADYNMQGASPVNVELFVDNVLRRQITTNIGNVGTINYTATNLAAGQTYQYEVCARNVNGQTCKADTFTTAGGTNPQGPDAITRAATSIDDDAATLNGDFDMRGTTGVETWFEWGTNSTLSNGRVDISSTSTTGSGSESYRLNGLNDDTTYYFKFCAENTTGTDCGAIDTFRTDDRSSGGGGGGGSRRRRPEVETLSPQQVTATSAELRGRLTDNENRTVDLYFEFGESRNDLDDTIDAGRSRTEKTYQERINGLRPNTRYYYRFCGDIDREDCGSIESFTTDGGIIIPQSQLVATTLGVTGVSTRGATLQGQYAGAPVSGVQYQFHYGRSAALGITSPIRFNAGSAGFVTERLGNLAPGITYYYRVVAITPAGVARGAIQTFRTTGSTGGGGGTVIIREAEAAEPVGGGDQNISLIIENDEEILTLDQMAIYHVDYKNLTDETLEDLVIHVQFPEQIRILASSDGSISNSNHTVTFQLDELEAGEEEDFVITTEVAAIPDGNTIVAEARLGYDDPEIDGATLTVIAYDVDQAYAPGDSRLNLAAFALGTGAIPGIMLFLLAILLIVIFYFIARRKYHESNLESQRVALQKEHIYNMRLRNLYNGDVPLPPQA